MAMAFVVALFVGSAGATGEAVVPVEGPWHATTSVGLPVGFEVSGGQVVDPRWRFKWGFCGSFENATSAVVPVNSSGYWKYTDLRGPWIEGTFVAPNRLEGTVTAPSRMLPGCPETHATFVAEPGAASFEQQRVVVLANVVTRRLASAPRGMVRGATARSGSTGSIGRTSAKESPVPPGGPSSGMGAGVAATGW